MDFNVEDSLVTNAGQITGAITPRITVTAVSASEEVGEITDFTGNVVSTSSSSFLMQGPYGMPRTIDLDSGTEYNGSNSLGTLTANAVVSVIGTLPADGSHPGEVRGTDHDRRRVCLRARSGGEPRLWSGHIRSHP